MSAHNLLLALAVSLALHLFSAPVCAQNEAPDKSQIAQSFLLPLNGALGPPRSTVEPSPELDVTKAGTDAVPAPGLPGEGSTPPLVSLTPRLDPEIGVIDESGVIVVDNDQIKGLQVVEDYQWQELPDQPGKTSITAGARFPVEVISSHTSKTAMVGDPVEARLKVDIKIGGRLVAAKGDRVLGHVRKVERARRMIQAEFTPRRWLRPSGALGIQFDEIITAGGVHLKLAALPAQQSRIVKNQAEGRVMGVNHNGEVTSPLSIQLKHQALHLAIRAAASSAGVFSFGIVPVAYACVGAMNPSFAFMQPVGKNVPHRRLKGFAMGLVAGMPGGFLISDTIIKGKEANVKPGDEFQAELKQEFTGEAYTEAEMMARANTRVYGEIIDQERKKSRAGLRK